MLFCQGKRSTLNSPPLSPWEAPAGVRENTVCLLLKLLLRSYFLQGSLVSISFCSSPTLTVVVPHFCGLCVSVGSSETAEQGFSSLLSSAESARRRMPSNTSPVRCCQCRAVPYRHFHISGEITNTQDPNPGRTPHSVSGPGSWGSLDLCVVSKTQTSVPLPLCAPAAKQGESCLDGQAPS